MLRAQGEIEQFIHFEAGKAGFLNFNLTSAEYLSKATTYEPFSG